MSEEFRAFNEQMMAQKAQEQEKVKDIFTGEEIPVDTDLSEEVSGTLAENDDDFVFPTDLPEHPVQEEQKEEPKKAEPKLTICRDNRPRTGFFMPMVFVPVDTKVAIQLHLNDLALKDESFKKCLQKEEKSFDECVKYIETRIFSEMIRQMGGMEKLRESATRIDGGFATSCQFSEEETYRLAEYYFRDDSIEQEKKRKAEMAEKQRKREEERKKAEKFAQKGKKKPQPSTTPPTTQKTDEPKKKEQKPNEELSLFDF